MARTNDSTKTIRGSNDECLDSPSPSAPSSDHHALGEYRVQRFMSEETSITAKLALQSTREANAEAAEATAKSRIAAAAAELLAFDIAFGEPSREAT